MKDIVKTKDDYQIAIISDMHIGDSRCTIFDLGNSDGYIEFKHCNNGIYYHDATKSFFNFPHDQLVMQKLSPNRFIAVEVDSSPNSKYNKLQELLRENKIKCLIVLGDFFDLAVQRNDIVYALVSKFLQRLQEDVGYMEYIFVPGNHDYSLWRSLKWEIDVVQKLNSNMQAMEAGHDVPGTISFANSELDLTLFDYQDTIINGEDNSQYRKLPENAAEYGATHLNQLLLKQNPERPIRIKIAYPNLYIIPKENSKEVVMLTHGHYFENKWTGMSNDLSKDKYIPFTKYLAKKFNLDLAAASTDEFFKNTYDTIGAEGANLNLAQLVQTNTINCSVQSGVMRESNMPARLFDLFLEYSKLYPLEPEENNDIASSTDIRTGLVLDKITESEQNEYCKQYEHISKVLMNEDSTKDNVSNYLKLSNLELCKLVKEKESSIKKLIFGHTHVPGCSNNTECLVGANLTNEKIDVDSYNVINTGCWLSESDKSGKPDENKSPLIPILKNGNITELKYIKY